MVNKFLYKYNKSKNNIKLYLKSLVNVNKN